jgi:hypothetical protein
MLHPADLVHGYFMSHQKQTAEQVGLSGIISEFYSRGIRFESLLGLPMRFSHNPPGKCRDYNCLRHR